MNHTDTPDHELVTLAQKGDEKALNVFLRRYRTKMSAYIRSLCHEQEVQDEMLGIVMMRMWKGLNGIRNPHAVSSWATSLTRNCFYDYLRSTRRTIDIACSLDEPIGCFEEPVNRHELIPSTKPSPDELMEREELLNKVKELMDDLGPQFRTAIILRQLEGLEYEEIALLTHVGVGTVKSRIHRAREKLQRALQPLMEVA